MKMHKKKTSWGEVADWYQQLLKGEGTYQKEVILPNLLRLLEIQKSLPAGRQGETILDLACGPGFFSQEFLKKGAKVIGADIAKELIEIAKSNVQEDQRGRVLYFVSSADNLKFLKDESVDKAVIVLAVQNMENVQGVFNECSRVLKEGGKLFLVMNHPAFRIPKFSSWGWDKKYLPAGRQETQYRRIDSYLSESKEKIDMHPSAVSRKSASDYTLSFHRSLQFYFKALGKSDFAVSKLEEWNSNKKSEPGPRAKAEDRARKEIPLFLFLEAIKLNKL